MIINKWWATFICGIAGGVLAITVWAADTRYLTIVGFQQFTQQQQRQELTDRIEELTLKKNLKLTTEYENALLEQLIQRLNNKY